MAFFEGRVSDVFDIPKVGRVIMLTEIVGAPNAGMPVRIGDWRGEILDVGKNSTDGQVVSTRSCLTAETVAPYGLIAVSLSCPKPSRGELVRSEGERRV